MSMQNKRRFVGALLCVAAVAVLVSSWAWVLRSGEMSTDNAYIRADVTSIASKVAGYVTAVEIIDNQAVSKGDVLFRIDDQDYRARLAQAVANVDAAQARLKNVEAEVSLQQVLIRQAEAERSAAIAALDLAKRVSDRHNELVRTNVVSQALVDESTAAKSRAVANLSAASASVEAQQQRIQVLSAQRDAALAAVAQAKALCDLAQIDLDSTSVRAPVDGVVANRQVRVGRLVSPGVSLLDIVPVNDVWVVANFKETQVEYIRAGQHVRITVDGYPNEVFEGTVDSFSPGSGSAFSLLPPDNATGNFVRVVQRVPVKIRFRNNPLPGRLVPGLSARVVIGHDNETTSVSDSPDARQAPSSSLSKTDRAAS